MGDYDFLLVDDWDWDEGGSAPCDCPTAPRQFLIPPPPPPPAMGVCGGSPLGGSVGRSGGYFCHLEPMGAEFTQAGFPSLPIIAVCSSVVFVAVLVASFLLWRHKTKVQNLLPCKHEHHQGGPCEMSGGGPNGVTYEDVLINHHPTRLPLGTGTLVGGQALMPIELLDVKLGEIISPESQVLHPRPFYTCSDNQVRTLSGKPVFHHPVYEEISREPSAAGKSVSKSYDSDIEESGRCGRSFTSEDDFAEDELSGLGYPSGDGSRHCSATSSVQGSTGGDLCRDPVSSDEGAGNEGDFPSPHEALDEGNPFAYPGSHIGRLHQDFPTNMGANNDGLGFCSNVPPPEVGFNGLGFPEDHQQQFLVQPRGPYVAGIPWCHPPSVVRDPLHSPVIENIYSTIDDGDAMVDRSCASRPSPRNVISTKKQHQENLNPSQLSQRNLAEDTESYGDILPAYDTSAQCPT